MQVEKKITGTEETAIFPTIFTLTIVAVIIIGTMVTYGIKFDAFLIGLILGLAVLGLMYAFLMKVLMDIKNLLKKNN